MRAAFFRKVASLRHSLQSPLQATDRSLAPCFPVFALRQALASDPLRRLVGETALWRITPAMECARGDRSWRAMLALECFPRL